jgi:poly(A) polymerase
MRMQIQDETIENIFQTTAEVFSEHEIYAVGGFPRDMILKRDTCDIDFATSANPDEIEEALLEVCPYNGIYRVGKRFGTLGCMASRLVNDKCYFPLEFTTYRSDVYDGQSRKPSVEFVETLNEDLARRDFTINALALDIRNNQLIDYFNGLQDLDDGIIRTPTEPKITFMDDPLRMLRAIRFVSQLGFKIEEKTLNSIHECSSEISRISVERIATELNKTLLGKNVAEALRIFVTSGLAKEIIPELLPMVKLAQNIEYHIKDVFEHTLMVIEKTPSILHIRLAALLHDVGKPKTYTENDGVIHFYRHEDVGYKMADKILKRLKYPNLIREKVRDLVKYHMRPVGAQSTKAVRRLNNELNKSAIELEDLLQLGSADVTSSRPDRIQEGYRIIQKIRDIHDELQRKKEDIVILPLDGHDIMEILNIEPSREIGYIKKGLEELIISEKLIFDDKEQAKKYVLELHGAYNNNQNIEDFIKNIGG